MASANRVPAAAAHTRTRWSQRDTASQQTTGQTLAEIAVWPLMPVKLKRTLPKPQPRKASLDARIRLLPRPNSTIHSAADGQVARRNASQTAIQSEAGSRKPLSPNQVSE